METFCFCDLQNRVVRQGGIAGPGLRETVGYRLGRDMTRHAMSGDPHLSNLFNKLRKKIAALYNRKNCTQSVQWSIYL
jgi:hypothetical protein